MQGIMPLVLSLVYPFLQGLQEGLGLPISNVPGGQNLEPALALTHGYGWRIWGGSHIP